MRKFKLLFALLAMVGVLFTSCEDEIGSAPQITFANGVSEATVTAAGDFQFTVTITSEEGLDRVEIIKVLDGSSSTLQTITTFEDKNDETMVVTVNVTESMVVQVKATDKESQSATKDFTITLTAAGGAIKSYAAKLMGAQTNTAYGSFLDADAGVVYKVADAATNQADVDIIYFYGSSNQATLAAPNDAGAADFGDFGLASWTTKNATLFVETEITATAFAAMTTDADFVDAASGTSKANKLSATDIVAFKTAAGKMELIHVSAISSTDGDGYMTVDVKIQE